MKGAGSMRLAIGAALAALAMPLGQHERSKLGAQTLDAMFTPRFTVPNGGNSRAKAGKHRLSGTVRGAGPRHYTTWFTGAANKPRRALGSCGEHYENRMRWLERNAHVIAKREADQALAMSDKGGRNRIMWGRK
jgi:hypothetical protein